MNILQGIFTNEDVNRIVNSMSLGAVRGIAVHTLIHPLEVIKTHQQTHLVTGLKKRGCLQTMGLIYQEDGLTGFSRGLSSQLLKTITKQLWSWPLMLEMPRRLEHYKIQHPYDQLITAFALSTLSVLGTPLEYAKIRAIVSRERQPFYQIIKNGWRGTQTYWIKSFVNWSTFLVAQKYFREKFRESIHRENLSLSELAIIGIKVAFIVSIASAPFDIANTLKQGKDIKPSQYIFSMSSYEFKAIRQIYTGWPMAASALIIQNVASVILLDKLHQ